MARLHQPTPFRLGGLRVVYAVGWNERRILIHYIGPREGAYEWRARSSRSNQRRPYFETIDSQLRLVRQKPWAKGFT